MSNVQVAMSICMVLTRFRFAEARDLLWGPLDVHVEMRRPLLLRDDGHPLKEYFVE